MMWQLLLAVAAATSSTSATSEPTMSPGEATTVADPWACPAACECSTPEGELEYSCRRNNSSFKLVAQPNDFIRISCEAGELQCSDVPRLPLSHGYLSSLGLTSCGAPPIACVLGRVGATGIGTLTLKEPSGPITRELVDGLANLTTLLVIEAVNQTSIPYEAIDSLPYLRDFRLQKAKVSLQSSADARPRHPSLKSLELMSTGIPELPPGGINFPGLKELSLWKNEIKNLTADSFIGLESLERLELSVNPLQELPDHVFSRLTLLQRLNLMGAPLRRVGRLAFAGLNKIQEVSIKLCRRPLAVEPQSFASLPSLLKLTIDQCTVATLPTDTLHGSHALVQLLITKAGLEELPAEIFQGLHNLSRLDLSRNKLKQLPAEVFWPLTALNELNLNDNNLQALPGKLFSGLKNLIAFTANNNAIKTIAPNAFQGAVALEIVSLASNQISLRAQGSALQYSDVTRQSPFNGLFKMRELILKDNGISEIMDDWKLLLVENLKKLDLSGNNFTELVKTDIQFLNDHIEVDLRRNKITSIDVFEAPDWITTEGLQRDPTNGRILLDDNPFVCDCRLYLFARRLHGARPFSSEPVLDVGEARCRSPDSLSGVLVKDITPDILTCSFDPTDCPSHCTCDMRPANYSLELDCVKDLTRYPDPSVFGLHTTKIRLHEPTSLANLPSHVKFLNMTGVGLTDVSHMPFTVEVADLSHNNLKRPPEFLNSNVSVYLAGNPFVCDCAHWEDVAVLQKYSGNIVDYKNITCDGNFLWRVDSLRLCDVRRATLLGGTLAAFGVIVVILATVCYKYRREMRLIMKDFFPGLFSDNYDKNAKYDAFISFAHQDAKWVVEQLVPRLENKGLYLCVHYRDWEVGEMIPDQIARSVQESNKTVVILTEHFVKSQWARLEFNTAYSSSKVLVVVLGEVPKREDLDDGLRAYITTNTYLKWGDPWFWEKLQDALPKRPKNADMSLPKKLRRGGLNGQLNVDGKLVNEIA